MTVLHRVVGSVGIAVAGAFTGLMVAGAAPDVALAQPQTKTQVRCVKAMNAQATKLGKVQGDEVRSCARDASKGTLVGMTVSECFDADRHGKLQKLESKTAAIDAKRCMTEPPDFGYTNPAAVNGAGRENRREASGRVLGSTPAFKGVR